LCQFDREVVALQADKYTLVTALPQHLRRRAATGEGNEASPVWGQDCIKHQGLVQHIDACTLQLIEEITGAKLNVKLR
jgi:hypothetical protein